MHYSPSPWLLVCWKGWCSHITTGHRKSINGCYFCSKYSMSAIFWNVHCPGPYVFMTSIMLFEPDHNTNYCRCWDKDATYFNQHFFLFQNKINHTVLKDLLDPIKELYEDVRRKALMRLEYEGLHKSEAITTPGVRFYNDPAGYAMNRYAYYVCYKCKKVWCYLLNVCYHFKSNFLNHMFNTWYMEQKSRIIFCL